MRFILLIICFALFVIACDNEILDDTNIGPTQVMAYNASTDTLSNFLYLNDFKINSNSLKYSQYSTYTELPFNEGNLILKDSITNNILYSLPILLRKNMRYSIFLVGKKAKNNYQYILTTDSLNAPSKGRAKYRFLNLFDFGFSVDFNLNNIANVKKDSLIHSNVFFNNVRDFKELKGGSYQIKIKFLHPNIKDSIVTKVDFVNGKIYTLLINEKLSKDSTKKMQLHILTNN